MLNNQIKKCSKCKQEKQISYFPKKRGRMFGVSSVCKSCNNLYKVEYRIKNKQKLEAYNKKYFSTLKGKSVRIASENNRRKASLGENISKEEIEELKNKTNKCYWCGISLRNIKAHLDHYNPLSKGGRNTIENIVVSCQKCNNKKHSKDPIVFANSIGKLL